MRRILCAYCVLIVRWYIWQHLVWVYPVCLGLSIQLLSVNTDHSFHHSVRHSFLLSNSQINFHCTFLKNCNGYKVETWYTHTQWVDVLCILESGPRAYNSKSIKFWCFYTFRLCLKILNSYKVQRLYMYCTVGRGNSYLKATRKLKRKIKQQQKTAKKLTHTCIEFPFSKYGRCYFLQEWFTVFLW